MLISMHTMELAVQATPLMWIQILESLGQLLIRIDFSNKNIGRYEFYVILNFLYLIFILLLADGEDKIWGIPSPKQIHAFTHNED